VEQQTGLRVEVDRVRDIVTDVDRSFDVPALDHYDRIIFDVRPTGGRLRPEQAEFQPAEQTRVKPYVARVLGREDARAGEADWPPETVAAPATPPTHRQRFAAYGLATNPDSQVLLTLIAPGYPGAGNWHLPGGGTDFGESAATGLLRELVEETDQRGDIVRLIDVTHRHHRSAMGPEGVPINWHGIRVIYRVRVTDPRPPRVVESDGSTEAAAWFSREQALALSLTEVAREMITNYLPD
jgi:ADP-ribose pyrophosphatase YjhB (NUDIX family)